jgi:D-arabinose 1-dehydrogenase-like Zn-dependent alcohol dehydrogenase
MKAAVVRRFHEELTIEEAPIPEAREGQVLVKVESSGVGHTDLHAAEGDWPVKPQPPFIPGHEGAGIVVAAGPNTNSVKDGDRVGIPWLDSTCGQCSYCESGWETLCLGQQNAGHSVNGSFAQYVLVASQYVAKIPDNVSFTDAAPLLCAGVTTYKGLKQTDVKPGQWVVISGIGGMRHLAIQYARAMGMFVAAVDVADEKPALRGVHGVTAVSTPPNRETRMVNHKRSGMGLAGRIATAAGIAIVLGLAAPLMGQNIGWEGETGVFVTPLGYVASSPSNNFGKPLVAFHFLNGGAVLGDFYEASVTVGALGRTEFGYTRAMHTAGNDPTFSPLWHNGFNIVHGKVNIVPENAGTNPWVPAIAIGFMARTQIHNVGGAMLNKDTNNGDIYFVATKTITQTKLPIIVNGGVRGTNAELWGMGGNAQEWEARAFGAAGFVVKLPNKGNLIFAVEVAQQPKHPDQLPTAIIPTTLTYCVRATPFPEHKLNIDFGVAQIAGKIAPGVDLHARARTAVQISYEF